MPEEAVISPNTYPDAASEEMIEAGLFYGRKKSKTNPKMKSYVLVNRGGLEIINLEKTLAGLNTALAFLKEKVKTGGLVLFVGTQPAAQQGIEKLAEEFAMPYVTNRWLGGTVTNYKILSKRVEYLKKLRADLKSGALDKYTKKERLDMEKEMKRLESLMGGLENLSHEPNVFVVVDPNLHMTAVREANRLKIPVIALANVDSDPDMLEYPVVGNNKSVKSIDWFFGKVREAMKEGIAERAKITLPEAEVAKPETASSAE